jgi:L-alanine-DL-glutamate epimerase-like enolase superfamily enzyme
MRIESVETAYYRLPLEPMGDAGHGAIDTEELITLALHAEGLTGNGYTYTIGRGGRAVKALIDHDLAPLIEGEDADDIEGLWDLMWRRLLYVGRGGLASFAIAAVDVALWDLRGEREGRPLYALIGAEPREIPAYGSGVDLPKPLDDLLAQVEGFMERGLPGVKVKIGRPDFEEDVRRVAAVRDLVGDGVDLMLDANMVWNAEDALEHGRRLERFDPFWYEEPTIPEDVPAHARMVRELGMPIAVGESLHSPYEFQRYADEGAVEVLQIDQQPLHRRAERPPAVRLEQPGLPGEARLRPRPLPARTPEGRGRQGPPDGDAGDWPALRRSRPGTPPSRVGRAGAPGDGDTLERPA